MFTILYETNSGVSATQAVDSNDRQKLVRHLAGFNFRVIAVYEQATPITNTIRRDLAGYSGGKTQHAANFINSRP